MILGYVTQRLRRELAEKGWRGTLAGYGGVRGVARAALLTITVAWSQFTLALSAVTGRSNLWVRLSRAAVARRFNRLYYYLRTNTFDNTRFMGKPIMKFPTDLWSYQEIIFERQPDVIIETGVFLAGSTFYFAKLCQMLGRGRIIGIDQTLDHVDPESRAQPNVTLLEGSSRDPAIIERVKALIHPGEKVMVILDADHTPEHVYPEMQLFAPLVSPGQYLVVEDGIISEVNPGFWKTRGPLSAVRRFLREHNEYLVDHYRVRFLLTHNPLGYLLKRDGQEDPRRFKRAEDCFRPLRLWLYGLSTEASWMDRLNQGKKQG